jgi:hypothetical protein
MTFVGILGILLGLLSWPMAYLERSRKRIAVFLLAYLAHVGCAVVYYVWVQSNSADTVLYFYDIYDMYGVEPLRPGTMVVLYLVQGLKGAIGGTYLDYFLLFQAFGFWGIVLLMRIFEEMHLELGVEQGPLAFLIVFLPGIHFWTSAIGKDAPLFFAASLAVWSAMRLRSRLPGFAVAIAIMILIRPHIALMAIMALAVAAFFDPRARFYAKIGLVLLAAVSATVAISSIETSFQVNVASADSVGEFINRTSESTQKIGGGTAVTGASYPVRMLSLLFRPFFIDAEGAFGLIASFENAFILFVVLTLLRSWRDVLRLARQVFFLRFAILFALVLMLMLALVYYNVGLGLRQKMMFMPGLLTMFVAVRATRQFRRAPATVSYA